MPLDYLLFYDLEAADSNSGTFIIERANSPLVPNVEPALKKISKNSDTLCGEEIVIFHTL